MSEAKQYLTKDDILNIFRDLAKSQGCYGRLLAKMQESDPEDVENWLQGLEDQHFTDNIDLIIYMEG